MTDRKRMKNPAARMRKLLAEQDCVILPGVHDPLSARLAELAGFEAAEIGGFAVEASLMGAPDMGIVTLTELADHASRITYAAEIPMIVDVDTGFGGIHNVARTVREMERAGVAGLHIEDQTTPKRCPALDGRQVVSVDEAVVRIQAALEARSNDDFIIIARCDADSVSYDELITRCRRYLEAGADLVLPVTISINGRAIESFGPDEQMELFARVVKDIDGPVMGMMNPEGYTGPQVAALGYKLLAMPANQLEASANAMKAYYEEARVDGVGANYFKRNPKVLTQGRSLMETMRLDDYLAFEERLRAPRPATELRRAANG